MLNFNFSDKGKVPSFSITFCVWFFKKILLRLHSINWPNVLSDCPYFPKYWVTYVWEKRKYLENEKSFLG